MKTIAIVIPYFGSFPSYFSYFITSCRNNPSIDWLIFSDAIFNEKLPENVHLIKMKWEQIKKRVQDNFDFQVSLNSPYKLCDYKPAYGEIFSAELRGYDFWAYGDMDVIYGNLREYLTEDKLLKYDRIYAHGHLSVHRNTEAVNSVYRNKVPGCYYYKDVFSSDNSYTFDEWGRQDQGGYYQIFISSGRSIYNHIEYADIDVIPFRFRCHFGGGWKRKDQRRI